MRKAAVTMEEYYKRKEELEKFNEKIIKKVDEERKSINRDQILNEIDSYNVEVKVSDMSEAEKNGSKEEFSRFVFRKNGLNKNTFYRDKENKNSYIMYDDNYSAVEYNLEKHQVICYGKNEKPVFIHSLNDDSKTLIDYDDNGNILYYDNSNGEYYLNYYDYYGNLLFKERFNFGLHKKEAVEGEYRIISYTVDEQEIKQCEALLYRKIENYDGVVLILKYKADELVSYESDFYKWNKVEDICKDENNSEYDGKKCSYIKVAERNDLKDTREINYKYRNLIMKHLGKVFLNKESKEYLEYTREYSIYDEAGRKIIGFEINGENFRKVAYEYSKDGDLDIVIKRYESEYENDVEYRYYSNGKLCSIAEINGLGISENEKYYNEQGILIFDRCNEYDDDGYKLSSDYSYSRTVDTYDVDDITNYSRYIYNDKKILIFKDVVEEDKGKFEKCRYNENGKLLYRKKPIFYSYNIYRREIYEYDDKDRLIYECIILHDKIVFDISIEYDDKNHKVKEISYVYKGDYYQEICEWFA